MGAPVCRVFYLELNATPYPTLHSPIYTRSQVADIQPRLYDVLHGMWDTISPRLLFLIVVISAVSLVRWPSQNYALCHHMQDLPVVPPPRTPPSQFCCVWSVRCGNLGVWIAVLSVPLSFLAFRSQSPLPLRLQVLATPTKRILGQRLEQSCFLVQKTSQKVR